MNEKIFSRRDFMKIGAFGATALGASVLLAGCTSTQTQENQSTTEISKQEETMQDTTSNNSTTTTNSGKVLVAYYSAQGHTKTVAENIATEAKAELFEIVPTEIYSDDDLNWTNSDSRVSREHDDESLRTVPLKETTPANWANYDTVLIGYPIWWGIAAWPVDNFVKDNDFSGKKVIPFCTSSSSALGQSGTLLANMAGAGNWQEGMRFSSSASASTVQDWVKGLNLQTQQQEKGFLNDRRNDVCNFKQRC